MQFRCVFYFIFARVVLLKYLFFDNLLIKKFCSKPLTTFVVMNLQ